MSPHRLWMWPCISSSEINDNSSCDQLLNGSSVCGITINTVQLRSCHNILERCGNKGSTWELVGHPLPPRSLECPPCPLCSLPSPTLSSASGHERTKACEHSLPWCGIPGRIEGPSSDTVDPYCSPKAVSSIHFSIPSHGQRAV